MWIFSSLYGDFTDLLPFFLEGKKIQLTKSWCGLGLWHLRDLTLRSLILPIGSLGIAAIAIGGLAVPTQKPIGGWNQGRRVDGVDML